MKLMMVNICVKPFLFLFQDFESNKLTISWVVVKLVPMQIEGGNTYPCLVVFLYQNSSIPNENEKNKKCLHPSCK